MNKKYSLKKSHDIEKLIKKKQSVGSKYYVIYYSFSDETQIAISISKKIGKAVIRNYNKRVIREIIRNNIVSFEGLTCLIVIKEKSTELNYTEKSVEILRLLNKIREGNNEK